MEGGKGRGREEGAGPSRNRGPYAVNWEGACGRPASGNQNLHACQNLLGEFRGRASPRHYSMRIQNGAKNLHFVYASPQGILRHNQV